MEPGEITVLGTQKSIQQTQSLDSVQQESRMNQQPVQQIFTMEQILNRKQELARNKEDRKKRIASMEQDIQVTQIGIDEITRMINQLQDEAPNCKDAQEIKELNEKMQVLAETYVHLNEELKEQARNKELWEEELEKFGQEEDSLDIQKYGLNNKQDFDESQEESEKYLNGREELKVLALEVTQTNFIIGEKVQEYSRAELEQRKWKASGQGTDERKKALEDQKKQLRKEIGELRREVYPKQKKLIDEVEKIRLESLTDKDDQAAKNEIRLDTLNRHIKCKGRYLTQTDEQTYQNVEIKQELILLETEREKLLERKRIQKDRQAGSRELVKQILSYRAQRSKESMPDDTALLDQYCKISFDEAALQPEKIISNLPEYLHNLETCQKVKEKKLQGTGLDEEKQKAYQKAERWSEYYVNHINTVLADYGIDWNADSFDGKEVSRVDLLKQEKAWENDTRTFRENQIADKMEGYDRQAAYEQLMTSKTWSQMYPEFLALVSRLQEVTLKDILANPRLYNEQLVFIKAVTDLMTKDKKKRNLKETKLLLPASDQELYVQSYAKAEKYFVDVMGILKVYDKPDQKKQKAARIPSQSVDNSLTELEKSVGISGKSKVLPPQQGYSNPEGMDRQIRLDATMTIQYKSNALYETGSSRHANDVYNRILGVCEFLSNRSDFSPKARKQFGKIKTMWENCIRIFSLTDGRSTDKRNAAEEMELEKIRGKLRKIVMCSDGLAERQHASDMLHYMNREQEGYLKVPAKANSHGNNSAIYLKENEQEFEQGFLDSRKENIQKSQNQQSSYHYKFVDKMDSPLFPHEVTLRDVVQGGLGDCYLLAAATGIVAADPQAIKDMMHDNGDGTVTVRFYAKADAGRTNRSMDAGNRKEIYVTVSKKIPYMFSEKNGIAFDSYARGSLWTKILEKAYSVARPQIIQIEGTSKKNKRGYLVSAGGHSTDAMRHILGRDSSLENIPTIKGLSAAKSQSLPTGTLVHEPQIEYTDTENQFFESIKNALNQKTTLCFGTKSQLPIRGKGTAGASGEGNSDGILTSHAYTILGYEQYKIGGQEVKFLRVRNPHGGNIAKYIYDQEHGLRREAVEFDESGLDYQRQTNGIFLLELRDFMSVSDRLYACKTNKNHLH